MQSTCHTYRKQGGQLFFLHVRLFNALYLYKQTDLTWSAAVRLEQKANVLLRFLTIKDFSKASRSQLYFQLQGVSADLPGIVTQAHRVGDVVHTHPR